MLPVISIFSGTGGLDLAAESTGVATTGLMLEWGNEEADTLRSNFDAPVIKADIRALPLQESGRDVVALDISPGATEACRRRGVRRTFTGTVVDLADQGTEPFDTVLLCGNNFGLLESPGNGSALRSCVVLTAVFGFVLNGLVAIIAAPPISDAAPWQDISHFGAAIAGFQATRLGIRQLGHEGSPPGGRLLVISVVILVATLAFAAPINLASISS